MKEDGRFVAEMGGKGNVQTIDAIYETLDEKGFDLKKINNPWYFPSISEYSYILERNGFKVDYMVHFDRPTLLDDL
ncbi:hypothetical protein ACFPYJ_05480 [Paenibacillus solisilvae]|uniref:Uncharacterized protein n=1 Tax=Paenibacillus solisilvae TaxID=2486751 RepID=A0ABW0VUJ3_9BACL